MKTFIQIFLSPYIFLFSVNAMAQKTILGSLKFTGTIDDKTVNTVRLIYNSSQCGFFEKAERTIDCKVKNGKFEFNLKNIPQIGYVQLLFPSSDGFSLCLNNHPKAGIVSEIFLAEAGDDIHAKITPTDISFSGKGAEKYNCEVKVQEQANEVRKNWPEKGKDEDGFTYFKNRDIKITEKSLELLKACKPVIDPISYSILELNYKTAGLLSFINIIGVRKDVKRFKENLDYFSLTAPSSLIAEKSKNYADFTYRKEQFLLKLENEAYTKGKNIPLEKYTDVINEKYNGPLKDKLLALILLCDAGDGYDVALKKALPLIKNKTYLSLLKESSRLRGAGSPFYNFQLQDTLGRTVSLKDLKDKVAIVDFYFTGCTGCRSLAVSMRPVVETFKNNPNVVFVSIDVDKKKETFCATVKKGLYTHPESVNLWTNGKGEKHELIKYYGFEGYPQLFLLDKDGKILYGKPPRPSGGDENPGESTKDFIKIIKDYLAANPSTTPAPIKMSKN
eukprot:gene10482-12203_t